MRSQRFRNRLVRRPGINGACRTRTRRKTKAKHETRRVFVAKTGCSHQVNVLSACLKVQWRATNMQSRATSELMDVSLDRFSNPISFQSSDSEAPTDGGTCSAIAAVRHSQEGTVGRLNCVLGPIKRLRVLGSRLIIRLRRSRAVSSIHTARLPTT